MHELILWTFSLVLSPFHASTHHLFLYLFFSKMWTVHIQAHPYYCSDHNTIAIRCRYRFPMNILGLFNKNIFKGRKAFSIQRVLKKSSLGSSQVSFFRTAKLQCNYHPPGKPYCKQPSYSPLVEYMRLAFTFSFGVVVLTERDVH